MGIGGLHNVCTTYKHCTFYSAIIKVRSSSQCKLHSAVQTDSDRGSPRVGIGGFTRLLPCNYTQLLSIHIASVRAIHTLQYSANILYTHSYIGHMQGGAQTFHMSNIENTLQ